MSGERHTRQGCAPGQKWGTLDRDDRDLGPVWAPPKSGRGGAERHLRMLAPDGCWCGQKYGHEWPGKAEGAAHPSGPRAIEEALAESARQVQHQIDEVVQKAQQQGVGVLVLTKRGVPWKCGPWAEVPAGEIQWRAAS